MSKPTIHMSYHSTDEGNSRVYYTTRSFKPHDRRLLFCLYQSDNRGSIVLYRCSLDGEPSHEVKPGPEFIFTCPPWDRESGPSELIKNVNIFINALYKGRK